MPTHGRGELDAPGAAECHERELFLDVVKREVPGFFLELRDEVLRYDLPSADLYDEPKRRRAKALAAWSQKYFVDLPGNEWLLSIANQVLRLWRDHPKHAETMEIRCALPSSPSTGCAPEGFQFEAGPWHPELEKWDAFAAQLAAAFFEARESYGKRQRARFAEAGAIAGSEFKDRSRQDLTWLVRYQFLGEAFRELARAHPRKAWQTVQERVQEAAKRIGLRLRESNEGGRPPLGGRN